MSKNRLRILQLFNRYLQYGGEEGSVLRIGDTLQEVADVGYFLSSSSDFVGRGVFRKATAPLFAFHNLKVARQLDKYQSIGKYDIWQIHNIFPFLSPAVYDLAYKRGIPVVQYLHNYRMSCVNGYFLNHGKTCTSCIHGNFTKAALTGCWHDSRLTSGFAGLVLVRMRSLGVFTKNAAWIALSANQKELHVRMGIPRDKIHIVPHFYRLDPAKRLSPGGRDVLFVGRLSKEKGVHELLDAWKLVSPSKSSLLLMGSGPEEVALAARIRSEDIRNVELLGFIPKEKQEEIWARSAFSVVPSIWQDPLPTVVFEAWERGRAVIATAVGGNIETIVEGVNGIKVEMGNSQQLAHAIDTLLRDPGMCIRMANAGCEDIGAKFSRFDWLQKMEYVYETCLHKK